MTPSVIVALNLFPFLSLSFTLMLRELGLSRLGFSKASRRVSTTCSRYAKFRNIPFYVPVLDGSRRGAGNLRRPATVFRRQAVKGKLFELYKSQLGRSRVFPAWNRSKGSVIRKSSYFPVVQMHSGIRYLCSERWARWIVRTEQRS